MEKRPHEDAIAERRMRAAPQPEANIEMLPDHILVEHAIDQSMSRKAADKTRQNLAATNRRFYQLFQTEDKRGAASREATMFWDKFDNSDVTLDDLITHIKNVFTYQSDGRFRNITPKPGFFYEREHFLDDLKNIVQRENLHHNVQSVLSRLYTDLKSNDETEKNVVRDDNTRIKIGDISIVTAGIDATENYEIHLQRFIPVDQSINPYITFYTGTAAGQRMVALNVNADTLLDHNAWEENSTEQTRIHLFNAVFQQGFNFDQTASQAHKVWIDGSCEWWPTTTIEKEDSPQVAAKFIANAIITNWHIYRAGRHIETGDVKVMDIAI